MRKMTVTSKTLGNKFIRNKKGHVVISQFPNVPIIGWFVFMIGANFTDGSQVRADLLFISTTFLLIWAYLELTQGASYFRRTLGAIVFFGVIISHLQ